MGIPDEKNDTNPVVHDCLVIFGGQDISTLLQLDLNVTENPKTEMT